MAYAIAYCAHTWEMNALRGWAVAFLAYVATATGERSPWIAPHHRRDGHGASSARGQCGGNEVSIRLGRQRLVRLAMTSCVACGAVIGFLGARSYHSRSARLVYGLLIWLDSSSLTAGAAGSADPRRRGATLALHSMAGYAGGFVGPLMIAGSSIVLGACRPSAGASPSCMSPSSP